MSNEAKGFAAIRKGAWLCPCGTGNPLETYTCVKCHHVRPSLGMKAQNRIAVAQGTAKFAHQAYNRTWVEALVKAADVLKI